MGKLPVLKPLEVVKLLSKQGFVQVRQRGSHQQFQHADGRVTTVPFHQGRDISPVLLRQIARDIGMTIEEFLDRPKPKKSKPRPRKASKPTEANGSAADESASDK